MFNPIHFIRIFAEVYAICAAALIFVAFAISTIHTWIDGKAAPWVVGDVPAAEARAASEGWLHRQLDALDIWMNSFFFNGMSGMTMSTHAYIASLQGKLWGKLMNKWLDWFQPNHGPQAASGDLERGTALVAVLTKLLQG